MLELKTLSNSRTNKLLDQEQQRVGQSTYRLTLKEPKYARL